MIDKGQKSLLAQALADIIENQFHFSKKYKVKFDRKNFIYRFIFDSGEEAFVNLEILTKYFTKDSYGCNVVLGVEKKGLISDIMFNKLKLSCYINPGTLLITFNSTNVTEEREISSGSDPKIQLQQLFDNIKDYTIFILAFINDYAELLQLLISNSYKGMIIENKFTFGMIVMGLNNSMQKLDKWVELAQNDKWFGDFYKSVDYKNEIIVPVKEYFNLM